MLIPLTASVQTKRTAEHVLTLSSPSWSRRQQCMCFGFLAFPQEEGSLVPVWCGVLMIPSDWMIHCRTTSYNLGDGISGKVGGVMDHTITAAHVDMVVGAHWTGSIVIGVFSVTRGYILGLIHSGHILWIWFIVLLLDFSSFSLYFVFGCLWTFHIVLINFWLLIPVLGRAPFTLVWLWTLRSHPVFFNENHSNLCDLKKNRFLHNFGPTFMWLECHRLKCEPSKGFSLSKLHSCKVL